MRTLLHLHVLLAITLAAGCTSYARVATRNAPGVIDISEPPLRERGTAEEYTPPDGAPATEAVVLWLHPEVGGGLIRRGAGWELGLSLSLEREGKTKATDGFAANAWGVSAGVGIAQIYEHATDEHEKVELPGALWLEGYHRRFIVMFGLGPMVYPDTRDVGVQATIRAPLCHVRLRYAQDSGFEAMLAWDLSFPFAFAWSQ
jgi:hypothetical protein